MINNTVFNDAFNSSVRDIDAVVEVYAGASTPYTWNCQDCLKSFTVERIGEEGKFFGFGIVHRLNLHIIDTNRAVNFEESKAYEINLMYKHGNSYLNPYPFFYITEVNRDENTNELSITAYDGLYEAAQHTYAEVDVNNSIYTISNFADACLSTIYCSVGEPINTPYNLFHSGGYFNRFLLNYEGTETIRDVLDDIAEYTQTIYYLDGESGYVVFKRLNKDAEPLFTIDREKYFTLDSKTNRRLSTIVKSTELGDDVSVTTGVSGSTQYIRNNGLYELLDADTLTMYLDEAIAAVGDLSINQFECEWRGNPLIEIGDKIALETKDGGTAISFLLDDVITYDGSLKQKSRWAYVDNEGETHANPVTLGEALKKTYAKVDKANKEIEIVADETAMLKINGELISNSVTNIEKQMNDTSGAIEDLTQKVEATMTAEQVNIAIQNQLANGVTSVTTTTGFTFNADGLTVSKSDSDISTTITEDGMTINKKDKTLLTANNVGVNATNLHATTYLIVGTYSRFEDYEQNGKRTGCFWIAN